MSYSILRYSGAFCLNSSFFCVCCCFHFDLLCLRINSIIKQQMKSFFLSVSIEMLKITLPKLLITSFISCFMCVFTAAVYFFHLFTHSPIDFVVLYFSYEMLLNINTPFYNEMMRCSEPVKNCLIWFLIIFKNAFSYSYANKEWKKKCAKPCLQRRIHTFQHWIEKLFVHFIGFFFSLFV